MYNTREPRKTKVLDVRHLYRDGKWGFEVTSEVEVYEGWIEPNDVVSFGERTVIGLDGTPIVAKLYIAISGEMFIDPKRSE